MGWTLEQKKPDFRYVKHRYQIYVWSSDWRFEKYRYCFSLERCKELLTEAKARFPDAEKFTVETVTTTTWDVRETGGE